MSPEQASAESGRRRPHRPVQPRLRAVRDAGRRAAVRGHRCPRHHGPARDRDARRRSARRRPNVPLAVERALAAGAGQVAGRTVRQHDRVRGRAGGPDARTWPRRWPARQTTPGRSPCCRSSTPAPIPENEYFSDGITDELITALTKVEGLQVASRTSVFALKGVREDVRDARGPAQRERDARGLGAAGRPAAPDHRPAHQRARRADALVGALRPRAGRRVRHPGRDRADHRRHAARPRCSRTSATRRRCATPPTCKAYQLYLKGRYSWNRRTPAAIAEGIRYFEAAIAEDAGYALAYTGLADSYALQIDYRGAPVREGLERARAEAQRALALDETPGRGAHLAGVGHLHLRLGLADSPASTSGARSSSTRATRWPGSGTPGS